MSFIEYYSVLMFVDDKWCLDRCLFFFLGCSCYFFVSTENKQPVCSCF